MMRRRSVNWKRFRNICQFKLKRATEGEVDGLFIDSGGRVFVPDVQHLRLRLCIVAHQGIGGHRGFDTTIHWLTPRFVWPGIDTDVRIFCAACLHCLRTKGGKTVPRPWLHVPSASGPNEVIHFDYVYIREAKDEMTPEYVLVIVDGFSRFVWMHAVRAATATNTVTALMQWFGLFGVCREWVSDQGRHFLNDVMEQLRARLGADHRFTTAYAPWSNGIVERVGRSLREILSALMSELKGTLSATQWHLLLPLVNSVINQSPSSAIGGIAPITAFTGRQPRSPLDVIFAPTRAGSGVSLTIEGVQQKVAALERSLEETVQAVRNVTPRKHTKRPGVKDVDFGIGDYVLIASARGGGRKDKTAPLWRGPGLVIASVNDRSFRIRDLLSDEERVVHADHLKRYADSSLQVTPQLKSFIAAQAVHLRVEVIAGHRKVDGKWQLRVLWKGFSEEDATWEALLGLAEDVPELVRRYVKSVQDSVVKRELTTVLSSCRTVSGRVRGLVQDRSVSQ
jgi:transposase InsO family protein